MGLTKEISTLAMIYSPLLILVLSILRPGRTGRISRRVRIGRRVLSGRTRRTGSGRAGEAPGYLFENGSTGHGCRGAHEKLECERLRVRTFRHRHFGWLLAWLRRRFAWPHRISWQRRLASAFLRRAIPRRGIPRRGIPSNGSLRRGSRGITATQTLLPNFPRRTEYGQQGQRSYSDMKVALRNWHGQGSGYIRCSKGKDNDSHIRRHG
jgi:hypothetical protein